MKFSWAARLKNLVFPKPVSAASTAWQETPEQKAQRRLKKLEEIKPFLQPDGTYLFDLEIARDPEGLFSADCSDGHVHGTQKGGTCVDTGLVAPCVKATMKLNYDFNVTAVHYRKRDSGLIINGEDETIGLPVGTGYQVLVIPENCSNPPAIPPAVKQPQGVCGLRHPAP